MADDHEYRSAHGRRSWVFLPALLIYLLAFGLPGNEGRPFGGLYLFVYGALGFWITLASLPAQFAAGGSFSSGDGEWLMLTACWCANPVFWYALSKVARGRRAIVASALAVILASLLIWLSLSNPEHRVELQFPANPAYWVWLGSMVVLFCGMCAERFRRNHVGLTPRRSPHLIRRPVDKPSPPAATT